MSSPTRAKQSAGGDKGATTAAGGKKSKKKQLPTEEDLAKIRLQLVRVAEQSRHLDHLVRENASLRDIGEELGSTLTQQVSTQTAVIQDLDDELTKTDLELAAWRRNIDAATARRAQIHEEDARLVAAMTARHDQVVAALMGDLTHQRALYAANADLREEKRALYEALEVAGAEAARACHAHHVGVSDLEHACLFEKATLRRDMLAKLASTKLGLLDKVGHQLITTTRRALLEQQQVAQELAFQGAMTQRAMIDADSHTARLAALRRAAELALQGLGMARATEARVQRRVERASRQLAALQDLAIARDVAGYKRMRAAETSEAAQRRARDKTRGVALGGARTVQQQAPASTTKTAKSATGPLLTAAGFPLLRPGPAQPPAPEAASWARIGDELGLTAPALGPRAAAVAAAQAPPASARAQPPAAHRSPFSPQDAARMAAVAGAQPSAHALPTGRVRLLHDAVTAAAAELEATIGKVAALRAHAAKAQGGAQRLLALQADALELIDLALGDVRRQVALSKGHGAARQHEQGGDEEGEQEGEDGDKRAGAGAGIDPTVPSQLEDLVAETRRAGDGAGAGAGAGVAGIDPVALAARQAEWAAAAAAPVSASWPARIADAHVVPAAALTAWPLELGIPPRLTMVRYADAQLLLAMLHHKLDQRPDVDAAAAALAAPATEEEAAALAAAMADDDDDGAGAGAGAGVGAESSGDYGTAAQD